MTQKVRVGTFSPSVLLAVAAESGALAAAELEVEEIAATSSPAHFRDLVAGTVDVSLTSPDNLLAYRYVDANPLGGTFDVRILAAVDGGLGLSLFSAPGRDDVDALMGQPLGVDVSVSGFAFVAYELLAEQGLHAGMDCPVVPLGATPRRAEALLAGRCAATVLNAGSDLRAEGQGARRLARASSLGPYLGTVLAAHGPVVDGDTGRLWRFTQALVTTAARLAAGELREEAARGAISRLGLDDLAARRYVDTLVDPVEGLVPDGRVDRESIGTIVRLRNRYSRSDCPLTTEKVLAGGLVDDRFLGPGLAFRVNGDPVVSPAPGATALIHVLRNDLGLVGTRFGCGSGLCGACLVLVDGHPTPACDTPLWSVRDKDVVTVEGLAPHPVQQALVEQQAAQCGYCMSGIVVNAAALLAAEPAPSEDVIRRHLDRNLCRCGAQNRVVRAVRRAVEMT
ncbi:2Fe-2S iron-sulfur cluster-binding protein [Actinomycetes bacterium KLBMP 9759]